VAKNFSEQTNKLLNQLNFKLYKTLKYHN